MKREKYIKLRHEFYKKTKTRSVADKDAYIDWLEDKVVKNNAVLPVVSVAKHPLPRPLECWNKARELDCGDYIEWHLNKERGNAR